VHRKRIKQRRGWELKGRQPDLPLRREFRGRCKFAPDGEARTRAGAQRTEEEFSSGPTFPTDGTGAPLAHRTKTTALAGTKIRRKPFRNMKMKTKTKISQIVFLVLDFELSVSFWGREDKQCQTA